MTFKNNNEERPQTDAQSLARAYVAPQATPYVFEVTSIMTPSAPFAGTGGDGGGSLDVFLED